MPNIEVQVPQLSESVTEATILKWAKAVGEPVFVDEILVTLETDKVILEVPAPANGTLTELVGNEGQIVTAGQLICRIESDTLQTAVPHDKHDTGATPNAERSRAATYDVVVIGAGSAGYIAAIRAAQLGKSVAVVEEWKNSEGVVTLGGTCANVGCIPSKALLASSEMYENVMRHLDDHGISVGSTQIDLTKMLQRKKKVVGKMTKGIEFLFRKNEIVWLKGHATLLERQEAGILLSVEGDSDTTHLLGNSLIIATGSKARHLETAVVDNVIVADNEGALSFDSIPKQLAIIGAGVIGVELGSVWRRLGSTVTILEALPTFLAAADQAISKEALKQFGNQGLDIRLGVTIGEIAKREDGVRINYIDAAGKSEILDADRLIISIGRRPNTEGLGLENIGLTVDDRGFIPVDEQCATSIKNVYAIGDVVRGPMLAHKAEDEGSMVAEIIDGQKPHIDYNCIPWVIYTEPEIAWVGKTEQQLNSEGRKIKTGQFPLLANGRALGIGKTVGFVKVIADDISDEVLGVHMICANASDLIAEAVVAMEFKASSEDIARICHPHPSLSEAVREAALAVSKRALNI